MWPNAPGELLLVAQRTLEAVSCTPWCGEGPEESRGGSCYSLCTSLLAGLGRSRTVLTSGSRLKAVSPRHTSPLSDTHGSARRTCIDKPTPHNNRLFGSHELSESLGPANLNSHELQ